MARALPTQNSIQSQPRSLADGAGRVSMAVTGHSPLKVSKKRPSSSVTESNDGAAKRTGW